MIEVGEQQEASGPEGNRPGQCREQYGKDNEDKTNEEEDKE